MRKFAVLFVVAVLSFGFVGCASPVEKQWGMADEGIGYVQELEVEQDEYGDGGTTCTIVISYNGRTSEPFHAYGDTLSCLEVGDKVKMRLSFYAEPLGILASAAYFVSSSKIDEIYGRPIYFVVNFKK